MEMGEKFVENDFFKNFGHKWKVRNGTVVFQASKQLTPNERNKTAETTSKPETVAYLQA